MLHKIIQAQKLAQKVADSVEDYDRQDNTYSTVLKYLLEQINNIQTPIQKRNTLIKKRY